MQDPETKAILGAVYQEGSKSLRVKANKGVIMCLGGFERNPEMLQDYLSIAKGYHLAGDCDTGDGFKICEDIGADFWHMNSMAGTWNGAMKFDGSEHAAWFTMGRQYGITVGVNGRRYYMDVDYVVSQSWYDYVKGEADLTTTTSCRHGHYNFGGEWPHMILPATSWFVFDDANMDNAVRGGIGVLTEGDPVEEGWAVKADTIEELATLIDVPADELAQTVAIWNESCDKGVDVQFYRAPDWQTKIVQPPFYAIRCEPEFINTDGGPVRNAKAQILDREGNPIPNLYSSGEFGSVWCNMYQGGGKPERMRQLLAHCRGHHSRQVALARAKGARATHLVWMRRMRTAMARQGKAQRLLRLPFLRGMLCCLHPFGLPMPQNGRLSTLVCFRLVIAWEVHRGLPIHFRCEKGS